MEIDNVHKTSHQYQGKINGKTFVVPHGKLDIYSDKYYKAHSDETITSREHVAQHNPDFSKEEIDAVHAHIKKVHGTKMNEEKSVFDKHQIKIAKQTLKMHPAAVGFMGGPDHEESRKILKKHGWSDEQIKKHELSEEHLNEEKKFDIYHKNKYHVSTTQSKTAKEAKEKYLKAYPKHNPNDVKVSLSEGCVEYVEDPSVTADDYREEMLSEMYRTIAAQYAALMKPIPDHIYHHGKDEDLHAIIAHHRKKAVETAKTDPDAAKKHQEHVENAKKVLIYRKKTATQLREELELNEAFKKHLTASGEVDHKKVNTQYKRNENQNRHMENVVLLAKHYGTEDEHATATNHLEDGKKAGHNIHHEENSKLHIALLNKMRKAQGNPEINEESLLGELHQSDYSWHHELQSSSPTLHGHPFHHSSDPELRTLHTFHSQQAVKKIRTDPHAAKRHQRHADDAKAIMDQREKTMKEQNILTTVKEVINEALYSRKHFRQIADVISKHPDQKKRNEMATHHAEIFSKSNPRFDHKRFFDAAGATQHVKEETSSQLDEVSKKTIASYLTKATADVKNYSYRSGMNDGLAAHERLAGNTDSHDKTKAVSKLESDRVKKRFSGITKAIKRIDRS